MNVEHRNGRVWIGGPNDGIYTPKQAIDLANAIRRAVSEAEAYRQREAQAVVEDYLANAQSNPKPGDVLRELAKTAYEGYCGIAAYECSDTDSQIAAMIAKLAEDTADRLDKS